MAMRTLRDLPARGAATLLRTRWLVRAPVWLYRARLGAVLGRRLLMLQHTGRTSGLPRYVVLEVVDHPTPDRWIVVSGFGERAQWYRNVRHDPQVRLYVGSRRPVPAVATRLDPDDGGQVLERYADEHPQAWSRLRPVLERTLGRPVSQDASDLPVVALDRS